MKTRPSSLALLVIALFSTVVSGVEKVAVSGLFKDKAIVVIDGKSRLLSSGQTSPEGVTLVSASSSVAVIEIAGQRQTLELGTQIGASFAEPVRETVSIWPGADRMYLVTGSVHRFPVQFLVDTGATLIAMNTAHAKRFGVDFLADGEETVMGTASGLTRAYLVNLERVTVGRIELRNVEAVVNDSTEFPREVLLGMSFLSRVDMRHNGDVLELRKKY